ncbi:MAG: orotidine-5'-phosphate decarboxylase [Desulfovibrionaceae bacterium]|nr:orotidine-5'-phosphate decarboxylase [Desulfovibrionaceae bacterium]
MAELVVALDVAEAEQGIALAQSLQGTAPWVKIGLELFTLGGAGIVAACKSMGFKVFLDLKFYDIPNTVAGAVSAAASMGVDMLTLHTQGGETMCRAARTACQQCATKPLLFGVTVLTSMADGDLPAHKGNLGQLAVSLAQGAERWGLDGVVCSGHEVQRIKQASPNLLCLTPGIRPAGSAVGDQKRVMTPQQAVAAGSDFLVIGRPITRHEHPAQAAQAIMHSMS